MPRAGAADFREEQLAARANELADDLGNLVNRTITLVNRFRPDGVDASAPPPDEADLLLAAVAQADDAIASDLDRFDFRAAADSLWNVVAEANRLVSATRAWELGKAEREGGLRTDKFRPLKLAVRSPTSRSPFGEARSATLPAVRA